MSFREKLKTLTNRWYYTKNEIDERPLPVSIKVVNGGNSLSNVLIGIASYNGREFDINYEIGVTNNRGYATIPLTPNAHTHFFVDDMTTFFYFKDKIVDKDNVLIVLDISKCDYDFTYAQQEI